MTIRDVAEIAGVSVGTASQVLNNKGQFKDSTRRRVFDAAARLGYGTEQPVQRRLQKLIILYPGTLKSGVESHEIFHDIYRSVARAAQPTVPSISLIPSDIDSFPLRVLLDNHDVDAVISLGIGEEHPVCNALRQRNIPQLLMMRMPQSSDLSWVSIDHEQAAFDATKHLASLGHRRIHFICHRDDTGFGNQRMEGYARALADANIADGLGGVTTCTSADAENAIDDLLSGPHPPTAIFASPDLLAVQVIEIAKARGIRVPEDLSVIGFDNLKVAQQSTPALSTIGAPRELAGSMAVEALRMIFEKGLLQVGIRLPHELIVRESCGLVV